MTDSKDYARGATMGDVALAGSSKRRDVFDRLRRRIELYKRRHGTGSWGRYEPWSNGGGGYGGGVDHQRQEIQLLHQRWQENKAKRAAARGSTTADASQDAAVTNTK